MRRVLILAWTGWLAVGCGGLAAGAAAAAAWEQREGYRLRRVEPGTARAGGGFHLMDAQAAGVWFTNSLSRERYTTNQMYLNGSGVAAGDVDGDGWVDLYFCGMDHPNRLFRNLGDWRFEDITDAAGLACSHLAASGVAFADLDGDGSLDAVVNSVGGGTEVYLNDGGARFQRRAVLNPHRAGMSLALADVDGDGDLDLYVTNYRTSTIRDHPNARLRITNTGGRPVVVAVDDRPVTEPDLQGRFELSLSGKILELGEVDALFLNDGKAVFTPVSFVGGAFMDEDGQPLAQPPRDWGLSAMFRDINQDGVPDLYVCNDFDAVDRIWLGDGRGRFRALPRYGLRHTSMFSMGVDFADIDRDGRDDFLVVDMLSRDRVRRLVQVGELAPSMQQIGRVDDRPQYMRNVLFWNRGDGTYAETAFAAGLHASEWSWTPAFLDVDLDGYEDVLITTGHERDAMHADVIDRAEQIKAQKKLTPLEQLKLRDLFERLNVENVAFRNRGDRTFEDRSAAWGFNLRAVSHGLALADLDNDGDLDVAINNLNDAAAIYRNESGAARLGVRLKGRGGNTRGVGARIEVAGGPAPQSQEILAGGRYLSSDDSMRVFAAAAATNHTVSVRWRAGGRTVISNLPPNVVCEIEEIPAAALESAAVAGRSDPLRPLFEDASHRLSHRHKDTPFDEALRQGWLPRDLSQLGPGVSWHDVNADGREDLIVAGGRGGLLGVYLNDGRGGFNPYREAPVSQSVTRDQTTVLGWTAASGETVLLAGSANYEDGLGLGALVRQYRIQGRAMDDSLPGADDSTGPLALADMDGDGDLDLFVGGRCVGGRYPEPATSRIFRRGPAGWELDAQNQPVLDKIGLVSGAVWTDLDGDGFAELVLACDWGPVRILKNERGALQDATAAWGLLETAGWWNGVTAGDVDGDGRLDLVASNWGQNHRWHAEGIGPLRLYYGEFLGNSMIQMIAARIDPDGSRAWPLDDLNVVSRALPTLRERFKTHEAFARATVAEVLGDGARSARATQAATWASTVFLNRGGRFEARPLPYEAQIAPAFGICVADFDGDGHEDLFLAQNFFPVFPEQHRLDSGRGLWLRGDGRGGWRAVPAPESGIRIYGDQRGAAVADYDQDGRVDIAVGQNGSDTQLLRNAEGKPGLRVRLAGPPGNPRGVGAVLRVRAAGREGPARELHAGSGYWSQDSAVTVLAAPAGPAQLLVRWPGGAETLAEIPAGEKEITVSGGTK